MAVVVHRTPHEARHVASRCSCAYLLWWLIWTVSIVTPYFLAYYMNNMWIKEASAIQQPSARFKHKAFVAIRSADATGILSDARWSTESTVNSLYGSSLRACQVSSVEVDDNRDGKPDTVEVTMAVPLAPNEKVYEASAILLFNYTLTESVDIDMEGLAYIHGSSNFPGSQLWVSGDLRLRQLRAVGYKSLDNVYAATSVDTESPTVHDILIPTILGEYAQRNLTTTIENEMKVWTPGDPGSITGKSRFELVARLRIPEESVRYIPGFWETMKVAWVQYLAIFIVVRYLVTLVENFIYDNRLLEFGTVMAQQPSRKPNF